MFLLILTNKPHLKIDFSQQSFGPLLFSLDNVDLKKKIKNIEKMNKRLFDIRSGINFNYICLKELFQPTFTNTYHITNTYLV